MLARTLLDRILVHPRLERHLSTAADAEVIYYHSGGRYFRKCLRERPSNEYKELRVASGWGDALLCLLSSSLYYWFWLVVSDCYHVTQRDVRTLPVPDSLGADPALQCLAGELLHDLWKNANRRARRRADGSRATEVQFDVARSRPILDAIDGVLGRHYQMTAEELDYVLSYDAAFRREDGVAWP
jgi:hypothetical protein